jgi:hypothetical protein
MAAWLDSLSHVYRRTLALGRTGRHSHTIPYGLVLDLASQTGKKETPTLQFRADEKRPERSPSPVGLPLTTGPRLTLTSKVTRQASLARFYRHHNLQSFLFLCLSFDLSSLPLFLPPLSLSFNTTPQHRNMSTTPLARVYGHNTADTVAPRRILPARHCSEQHKRIVRSSQHKSALVV